jgi:ATP/maltotriose-dependent transcriptional regulator MalT
MLAHLALLRGEIELARRLNIEALEASAPDDLGTRAIIEYVLGNSAVAAGDVEDATLHLERALAIVGPVFTSIVTPQVQAALAPLAALRGDTARAETLAGEAIERAAQLGLPAISALALTRGTEAAILSGDVPRARATMVRLLDLLRALGGRHYVADAVELSALIAERSGDPASSAHLLAVAHELRRAQGEPLGGSRATSAAVRECADRVLGREPRSDREVGAPDAIALALASVVRT